FLLLLCVVTVIRCDILKNHLANLVDRSVSPCDDFYHHVCSQKVDPEEFLAKKFGRMFSEAAEKMQQNATRNNAITVDILRMREDTYVPEENNYSALSRERCKMDIDCYREDQEYFREFANEHNVSIEVPQTDISLNDTQEQIISNYISDTSKMIDAMIPKINFTILPLLEISTEDFHQILISRIHMIEFLESNSTYGDFHDIKEIAEIMKLKMIEKVNESKWLHTDDISEFINGKIGERIANIQIYQDFDHLDRNLTILRKMNRDFTEYYFSNKRKTGVHKLDTLLRLDHAIDNLITEENLFFILRIMAKFKNNAQYLLIFNSIQLFAPLLYRPAMSTNIFQEPYLMHWIIGHELFHSVFTNQSPILLDLYGHRSECIEKHYENTCSTFGMGYCWSGNITITEDGADVEALRVVYDSFVKSHSSEQMVETVDDMGTTFEQAFFYFVSSFYCGKDRDGKPSNKNKHSPDNIRVNGVMSLMPEFSRAFGCKANDPMYTEEKKCNVFGAHS
ncbi:hypothetical protein PFISCL1PPCAC_26340, partial [Pristionchus fissidentatus]